MFERYRPGTSGLLNALVGSYNQLREITQTIDRLGAMNIDRARRRRRKVQRVDRLDTSLTETIDALAELETEVAGPAARELQDARGQLQWVLSTLRS